jgi:hypothetical protein
MVGCGEDIGMNTFGVEAKTFVNATPDLAITGAGWVEATKIRNLTCSEGKKEINVTDRSNGGYEATDCYFEQAVISFDMAVDPSNAAFVVLETAYNSNAPISAAVLGGVKGTTWGITASSARGPAGTWKITTFTVDRNVGDIQRVKITIKPLRNMVAVAPQPPTGVSASVVSGCIDVYYTNDANHDGFNLYYSTDNGVTWTIYSGNASLGVNWIRLMNGDGSSGLPTGHTYVFRLTSATTDWESKPSPTTNSVTI